MRFFRKRFITAVTAFLLLFALTGCNLIESGVLFLKKASVEANEPLVECDFTDRFYYSFLSEEEKRDYRILLAAYERMDSKVLGLNAKGEELAKLNKFILLDCPELFWVVNSGVYYSEPEALLFDIGVSYEPKYRYTRSEAIALSEQIDAICAPFVSEYTAASDYEKALAAYDFIIANTEYDSEMAESILLNEEYDRVNDTSQCITSVFIEGKSVCAGYSLAYQYLLGKLGIFSVSVIGTVEEDEEFSGYNHQWNLVRLDGEYYYTDVTWGEPEYNDIQTEYAYFCITEEELLLTHNPNDWVEYPEADSLEHNYYYKNGFYLETLDTLTVGKKIEDAISGKKSHLTFKFKEAADYLALCTYFETGQGKAAFLNVILREMEKSYEWFDLTNTAYSISDSLRIVRIHFSYK